MIISKHIIFLRWMVLTLLFTVHCSLFISPARAQNVDSTLAVVDSTLAAIDSTLATINAQALPDTAKVLTIDTTSVVVKKQRKEKVKRDWNTWTPDPQRALWLALVIPGAGQIYNRKYWKLPIIYGGFMGCIYALTWNNMMYKDYSQAYLDIMDNDPGTASYNKFLHLGAKVTKENEERYKKLFKSRGD